MIKVSGSYSKTYVFPAGLEDTYRYFQNLPHILELLPHISVVAQYRPEQFRMLYHTTELGLYRVRIYCDLAVVSDQAAHLLTVHPLQNGAPAVKSHASLYELTGQGLYSSCSEFRQAGNETLIDYELRLEFQVPPPLAVRLVPRQVTEMLAEKIANQRIREIADGFIRRAILDFQSRLA